MQPRVVVDLSLSAGGFAGIPHDVRTTFAMLSQISSIDCSGLILPPANNAVKVERSRNNTRLSDDESSIFFEALGPEHISKNYVHRRIQTFRSWARTANIPISSLRSKIGPAGQAFEVSTKQIGEILWERFFSQSVDPSLTQLILRQRYFGAAVTQGALYAAGLGIAPTPHISLPETDIFLSQRYFPGELTGDAKLAIRYHDSIPVTHPQTISNRAVASRIHRNTVKRNAANGFFICNSQTTRSTLLRFHPELSERAFVVHCSIPAYFYPDKDEAWRALLPPRSTSSLGQGGINDFDSYFLCVGTVEPRKNYATILEAWDELSAKLPQTRLLIVGSEGWGAKRERVQLERMVASGSTVLLTGLTPGELRKLYSSALAVITASFEEGFSYSGAEAMQCGTCVLASDIACHREIYGDAPVYFDPHESGSLYRAMNNVLRMGNGERAEKVQLGWQQVASYSESEVSNAWEDVIHAISAR